MEWLFDRRRGQRRDGQDDFVGPALPRPAQAVAVKPLLAVDADPNSCLAERLGVTRWRLATIGYLREQLRANPDKCPPGISKTEWIERLINEEVIESTGLDLIVMGRQEGPRLLLLHQQPPADCLEKIAEPYRAVVIDNEAGLEHLSRRTDGRVEVMLVVCQPTLSGARTARAHTRDDGEPRIGGGERPSWC